MTGSSSNQAGLAEILAPLRIQIDSLDEDIVRLLNARAEVAQKVGKAKSDVKAKAYVPDRERQVIKRLVEKSQGPLSPESLRLIYKEIISASLALESPMRVSFLGPKATFTHDATKRHFGMSAQLTPRLSIAEVFADVERKRSDFGVVPIENSTEGVVNHTLDSFMASDLIISAEVLSEVSHHLLNLSGVAEGITKVYSHPQPLAQCRGWLSTHLPQVPLIDVPSTARAAQLASEDAGAAAVASDMAASIYGLRIAASHLEDIAGNMTRFLVIGHDAPAPSGNDRTSVMFALKDAPGVLYDALGTFKKAGINMSRIESRPSRKQAWEYLFFIDVVGHATEVPLANAIEELSSYCEFVKVLGSYPRGELGKSRTIRDC